jgi:hypothetical protein
MVLMRRVWRPCFARGYRHYGFIVWDLLRSTAREEARARRWLDLAAFGYLLVAKAAQGMVASAIGSIFE